MSSPSQPKLSLATWNMQGANADTENKWNTIVEQMMVEHKLDVFCVQECGAVPQSFQAGTKYNFKDNNGNNDFVQIYDLPQTPNLRPRNRWLTYHHWDNNGNRVNMALLTNFEVNQKNVLAHWGKAGSAQWRPAIGFNPEGTAIWIFTIHAISPGGADGNALLAAVSSNRHSPWVVAGDFNREPKTLTLPSGVSCYDPEKGTYPTANPDATYDYCVGAGISSYQVAVLNTAPSDHLPVVYSLAIKV
jgi:cytolethal distending toxin subunit B